MKKPSNSRNTSVFDDGTVDQTSKMAKKRPRAHNSCTCLRQIYLQNRRELKTITIKMSGQTSAMHQKD